ncbi:MAG: hypothetical protein QF913_07820 [Nitrospinaceae bacterium]|nr:hypothetical protein [Nitrospinaceae bacterium]
MSKSKSILTVSKSINTVGELIAQLKKYPSDLVIESLDGEREVAGVSLWLSVPSQCEIDQGCYEMLMFCSDTVPTHRFFKKDK